MSDARTLPLLVPATHPALPGHFPSRPVVPGVVLLEAVVAALAPVTAGAPRLRGIRQARFVHPLLPGEPARIELSGPEGRPRFRILAGTVLVARGELEMQA